MATFTASQLASNVKEAHTGMQVASCVVTASVTGTASSVFKFVKVPNQATIVDFVWYGEDGAADQTYKLGLRLPISDTTTVTESVLSGDLSFTAGQTHRGGSKLPYHVSFTNNAIQQYAWVEAVAAGAISASAIHKFRLFYVMDDDVA